MSYRDFEPRRSSSEILRGCAEHELAEAEREETLAADSDAEAARFRERATARRKAAADYEQAAKALDGAAAPQPVKPIKKADWS